MYTIKLADGKKLEHLGVNGTYYISDTEVDRTIFENNCSTITIINEDTNEEEVLKNAYLVSQRKWKDGTFYLLFAEKTVENLLTDAINTNNENITDIQLALADIYEMIVGGKV